MPWGYAKLSGFDGDDEDWAEEFEDLCAEQGWNKDWNRHSGTAIATPPLHILKGCRVEFWGRKDIMKFQVVPSPEEQGLSRAEFSVLMMDAARLPDVGLGFSGKGGPNKHGSDTALSWSVMFSVSEVCSTFPSAAAWVQIQKSQVKKITTAHQSLPGAGALAVRVPCHPCCLASRQTFGWDGLRPPGGLGEPHKAWKEVGCAVCAEFWPENGSLGGGPAANAVLHVVSSFSTARSASSSRLEYYHNPRSTRTCQTACKGQSIFWDSISVLGVSTPQTNLEENSSNWRWSRGAPSPSRGTPIACNSSWWIGRIK